jgi:hypothetical protein
MATFLTFLIVSVVVFFIARRNLKTLFPSRVTPEAPASAPSAVVPPASPLGRVSPVSGQDGGSNPNLVPLYMPSQQIQSPQPLLQDSGRHRIPDSSKRS